MTTVDHVKGKGAAEVQPEGIRQSMSWLHTWAGLLLGWVLYAMFMTGTLAFFRDEITAYMKPEVQVQAVTPDQAMITGMRYLQTHAPDALRWFVLPYSDRDPVIEVSYQKPGKTGRGSFQRVQLDPATGEAVQARETRGGDFFYRFHYELEMGYPWGRWLASIAGMFMLVAIISGIITHKKIFKDFFTFRPGKGGQRSWMDGHNALSVLGLPFHLMITFSGLMLFMIMVMPAGIYAMYDTPNQFTAEAYPSFASKPRANVPAPMAPIENMIAQANTAWDGASVGRITVNHPGDSAMTVSLTRLVSERVSYGRLPPSIMFNGVTGEITSASENDSAIMTTVGTIVGLHLGKFAKPWLRWLYFIVSLAGTAMVASGLVLWVAKRRQKAGKDAANRFSLRLVDSLNSGTIAGLLVAIPVFFLANRLLPVDLPDHANWEVKLFLWSWGAAFVYGFVRQRQAWRDLNALAGVLFLLIPIVNAITTSRHLGRSLPAQDWLMAGFDLTAIASGIFCVWLSWKVSRHKAKAPAAAKSKPVARATPQGASAGFGETAAMAKAAAATPATTTAAKAPAATVAATAAPPVKTAAAAPPERRDDALPPDSAYQPR
ncbi:PepSY-associated TM helix domain-containing protein [Alcaligenaceae bacterium C4P045]|nr:PepSY-associated TM helix domain-containing protein [Alcaligenaceae bacterium C4P045]